MGYYEVSYNIDCAPACFSAHAPPKADTSSTKLCGMVYSDEQLVRRCRARRKGGSGFLERSELTTHTHDTGAMITYMCHDSWWHANPPLCRVHSLALYSRLLYPSVSVASCHDGQPNIEAYCSTHRCNKHPEKGRRQYWKGTDHLRVQSHTFIHSHVASRVHMQTSTHLMHGYAY